MFLFVLFTSARYLLFPALPRFSVVKVHHRDVFRLKVVRNCVKTILCNLTFLFPKKFEGFEQLEFVSYQVYSLIIGLVVHDAASPIPRVAFISGYQVRIRSKRPLWFRVKFNAFDCWPTRLHLRVNSSSRFCHKMRRLIRPWPNCHSWLRHRWEVAWGDCQDIFAETFGIFPWATLL